MLVLFACKDPFPFFKSSKIRNQLKPENFETLFLLSALKIPIKSHQLPNRNKILRRSLYTFLWFLDFETVCSYFNAQIHSHFIVGNNKSFVSLKNESFLFRTRVHFKGMESSLAKFWGGLLIKGKGRGWALGLVETFWLLDTFVSEYLSFN